MAGLTPQGFTILQEADVVSILESRARTLFQDLVPAGDVVDTGQNTTLGRMIRLIAPSLADLWAAGQQDYDAFSIDGATGIALDNLCALGGIVRKKPLSSVVSVALEGTPGITVTAGSTISSPSTSKNFNILEDVLLNAESCFGIKLDVPTVANSTAYTLKFVKVPDSLSEGTFTVTITSDSDATKAEILSAIKSAIDSSYSTLFATESTSDGYLWITLKDKFQKVTFTSTSNLSFIKVRKLSSSACTETGPIEAALNTITSIKTPILGWDSVYNPASAVLGQDLESDEELRARFKVTKGVDGVNSFEAIYSALRSVDGVLAMALYENTADTAGYPDGMSGGPTLPPHSIYAIVEGAETSQIAKAIWDNKPGGIDTFGGITTTVYDSETIPHSVSFDRPTPVDIYMELTIHTDDAFPQDGAAKIKQAIIDYMAATWSIGEDIEYSRLYTPINSIPGHYVVSFYIDTSASPAGTTNISIDYNEIFAISEANIDIAIA